MPIRKTLPATALVLSVMLAASVICSLPVLHRSAKAAAVSNTGSQQAVVKQAVAERAAVKPPPAEPLVPRRAGAGASPLSPDEEKAFLEYARVSTQSLNLAKQGDAAAKEGDWAGAQGYYRQALAVWPDDSLALYGMGQCAEAAGNTTGAIGYYRKVIYTSDPHSYGTVPGDGYGTNDVIRLMEFVLLLGEAGQEQEAVMVYRRTAHLLNYQDAQFNGGKQYLDVLLPEFGNKPGELAYTPQRLAAMAHVGIAYKRESLDHRLAQVELQKAIDLAPDSPVPYFYKAQSIVLAGGHRREALADFQMAAQLGDDDTRAAVDKKLKDYSVEREAKAEQEMEDLQKKQAAQKE